jgi:hypothetical protein
MIKKGDHIECINDDCNSIGFKHITVGKIYTINSISSITDEFNNRRFMFYINDDSGIEYGYYAERFINVSEIRRLKILKLNSISKI